MIASRLNVPVVPVRLEGLDKVLHHTWRMARPGPVRIAFGPALRLVGDDYEALAQQVGAYQQGTAAADHEIEQLTAQRAQLTASLDEDLLRRYDRLREAKGGVAIVAVRGGRCGGCHITIPERFTRRLEENPDTLAACDGCGRLLFVPR